MLFHSLHQIINASDGYPLESCIFSPKSDASGVIVLCPGLGIPKEYYFDYCSFLAKENYIAIVFDYRGIGKVKAKGSLGINLRNWALMDIPGILQWAKENYPEMPIYYIGHSIAGQMAELIPNYYLINRFIFISSTGGHWTLFDFPLNLLTIFMFFIHIPITVRIFGYMPQSLTYRGVRISKGVALEWAKISRKRDYFKACFGKTISHEYYSNIDHKIDWISFSDDAIATDRAVAYMIGYYPNAEITHHRFQVEKRKSGRIGHAGFFRKNSEYNFWRLPIDIINLKS